MWLFFSSFLKNKKEEKKLKELCEVFIENIAQKKYKNIKERSDLDEENVNIKEVENFYKDFYYFSYHGADNNYILSENCRIEPGKIKQEKIQTLQKYIFDLDRAIKNHFYLGSLLKFFDSSLITRKYKNFLKK